MKKEIAIGEIRIDRSTQCRPVDDNIVLRYMALIEDGAIFPAVEIVFDGKNHWMWDGHHRLEAYRKLGKDHIPANVEEGTKRDAIWLSFSANKKNAFPRQPGTAKEIVEKILKDKEWSKKSTREIANHVGITERYVFKIQSALKIYPMNSSEDRPDSKPKKQLSRADIRNVKRGESEYEAKVPEKKVLDATGKQVPEHLVKFFKRANEFRQPIKQLHDMLKTVRKGIESGDRIFRYIKIENLTAEIGNVKRIFRFGMPFSVCPYCGGDENNAECRACDGCGFVNEMTYKSTPKELK